MTSKSSIECPPQTLVILPTYDEAANVEQITRDLLAYRWLSILIIDDNSPDGTGAIADSLAERHRGRVTVIHRPTKQGLGSAYLDGFRHALAAKYEIVVQMDADFSHDPADVPRLVRALQTADVAIGSRYVTGAGVANWPTLRRFVSRFGSLYAKTILGLTINDATSGFKGFRYAALAQLDLSHVRARGFVFMVEVNWYCRQNGLSLVEVPITFVDRKLGRSKMTFRIFFEAVWLVWDLRFKCFGRTTCA